LGGLGIGHIHTEPRAEGKTRTILVWVRGNRSPLGIAQPEIIQENLTQTPPALWSWIKRWVCRPKVINSTSPPPMIYNGENHFKHEGEIFGGPNPTEPKQKVLQGQKGGVGEGGQGRVHAHKGCINTYLIPAHGGPTGLMKLGSHDVCDFWRNMEEGRFEELHLKII